MLLPSCCVFARTSRVDEQLMSPDITNDGEFCLSIRRVHVHRYVAYFSTTDRVGDSRHYNDNDNNPHR